MILFAVFICLGGTCTIYYLSHAQNQNVDVKGLLGLPSISYSGVNVDKVFHEIRGVPIFMKLLIQNILIFTERFEGPVKIVENSIPTLNDPRLKIETVITGLEFPTGMAFLGPDDILILEKNKGTVKRVLNGNMLQEPLLDVNVGTLSDRGILGIAISKQNDTMKDVFLYFTETSTKDGLDVIENVTKYNTSSYEWKEPIGNRLYRYKLINDTLTDPKLLIDIPANVPDKPNTGRHTGGKVIMNSDDNLYLVVGDIGGFETPTQNVQGNVSLNPTSVILRISKEGDAIGSMLGDKDPENKFYAYGIRNSFGMDFDPLTGMLWDTENGDQYNDEINLVRPGFNSGWLETMGMASNISDLSLTNFGGKGNYSDPEFVWAPPVAPTALKFLNSDELGKEYENDMFVGDFLYGNLYDFDLDYNRTKLALYGPLVDKIANTTAELQDIVFGTGFGSISDIQVGPDGYLYILSLYDDIGSPLPYHENSRGTIYKIYPDHP